MTKLINLIHGDETHIVELVSVYDGDTLTIRFVGAPSLINKIDVRLDNVDTPEIRGKTQYEKKLALKAKNLAIDHFTAGGNLYTTGEFCKYGRLICTAPELVTLLIESGVGRAYDGGARLPWKAPAKTAK